MNQSIVLLESLERMGIWGLLQTLVLIGGAIFGLTLLRPRRRFARDVNFFVTWDRAPNARFPLVLRIEIRNLSSSFIVISSAFVRFRHLRPGPHAHVDSASGEYEGKFRRSETDDQSEVACLLRHRETAICYIPLLDTQTDDEIKEMSRRNRVGSFHFDVVILGPRPTIKKFRLKLTGLVPYRGRDFEKSPGTAY